MAEKDAETSSRAPSTENSASSGPLVNSAGKGLRVVFASGNYLTFDNGTVVLDASSGAAVHSLGHGPILPIRSIFQSENISVSGQFSSSSAVEFAKELLATTEGKLAGVYICHSGSDATETALKVAIDFHMKSGQPDRNCFIARHQSYHGSTIAALSLGGHRQRRKQYKGLLCSNFHHVSACNPYRDLGGLSEATYVQAKAEELEKKILDLGPENVAGFVMEPVVGAALGCSPAVPGYTKALKAICKKHGVLFILDEIMCGAGRCGFMHTWLEDVEEEQAVPDIQLMGKGLGAGEQPIGVVLMSRQIKEVITQEPGFNHGFTFQNHSRTCAVGRRVLHLLSQHVNNVKHLGHVLGLLLHKELDGHENVGDIRGKGFFWGIEFVADKKTKAPFPPELSIHQRLQEKGIETGIFIYPGGGTADGDRGDHIMIAPPLNCNEQTIRLIVELVKLTIEGYFSGGLVKDRKAID